MRVLSHRDPAVIGELLGAMRAGAWSACSGTVTWPAPGFR